MTDSHPDLDPTARVVRVETTVPGTPEEVWQAIATGPGTTAWFVPAEIEEHEGGTVTTHHGPFGASTGTVTVWDPPHRFAYDEPDWKPEAPDAPVWSTEILVSARHGGTCVVRLTSGFVRGGDGWEGELDGTDTGWARMIVNLRLYLTHFPGQRAAALHVIGDPGVGADEAAAALLGGLGLRHTVVGDEVRAPNGAPAFAGVVEDVVERGVLVRTSEGLLEVGVWDHGGTVVTVGGHLYGPAADAADEHRRSWSDWLHTTFPGFAVPEPVAASG